MKAFIHILFFVCVLCVVEGCSNNSEYYQTITFDDGQTIPPSCSAWEDTCNTYCRKDTTNYDKIPNSHKCISENTVRFTCIDDFPDKLSLCLTTPE